MMLILAAAGSMYGEPNLTKESGELFRPEHRAGFNHLLASVNGVEIDPEDQAAYEDTLSYIGLMYKGITESLDSPLGTQRRIIAFPSLVPQRFAKLVESCDARALVILSHLFAIMKLCEAEDPWLQEIARRQVPQIGKHLVGPWIPLLDWPLEVLKGDRSVSEIAVAGGYI